MPPFSAPVSLYYASHNGHTPRIAAHMAARLQQQGLRVECINLNITPHAIPVPENITVLMAPIRYGYPLAVADAFLRRYACTLNPDNMAIFLINLTARKPGKTTPQGNPYLRKWLARRHITPAVAAAIAGNLDYPAYSWFNRTMIRFIMLMTGGPTDPTARVEYTDWAQVTALAGQVAQLARTTNLRQAA
jgi:menaquinone-dependent protoporphyrinogen oxidase